MAPYNRSNRRMIEGIPSLVWGGIGEEVIADDLIADDLTFIPTLRICLAHIGEEFSKVYLAGTSCAAFYIGWRADSLWSGMGGSVYAFPEDREPGLENLFKAIGRDFTVIKKSEPERLWEAAVLSINAGRPVVCVEWDPIPHRGHYAILTGYDQEKREFLGRSYTHKPLKEYVSLRPENLHYILVIGEKSKEKTSSYEAALGALRCAAQMSKMGIKIGEEEGACGLVAYERQAQMIPEGMDPKQNRYGLLEHFLFWRLEVLYQCRRYAIHYLKEIASEFPTFSRECLKAAEEYKKLIKIFDKHIRIIFPPESNEEKTSLLWREDNKEHPIRELFSTAKGRRQFAGLLLKMRDLEQKAIDEVEKTVEKY